MKGGLAIRGSASQLVLSCAGFVHRITMRLCAVLLVFHPVSVYALEDWEHYLFLGNNNIPPIIYLKDAKPAGVVVDLAQALAEKSGIDIEIQALDWPEAQSSVLIGEADALLQINPSDERKKLYDFSDHLLESSFCIFRKDSRVDIQSVETLYGHTVGVEEKGYPILLLKKYPQIKIRIIDSWKAGFELINAGELDAVLVDRWVGEHQLAVHNIRGIAVVNEPVKSVYSAIAVKKGNEHLLTKINMGLEGIRADGSMQRILDKWSTKETVYLTKEQFNSFVAFIIAAALVSLLLLVVLFYMYRIKKINKALQGAIDEIKTLRGIIPICSYCHSIRDDEGAWNRIEAYLSKYSEAEFSHGICPKCITKARADAGLDS